MLSLKKFLYATKRNKNNKLKTICYSDFNLKKEKNKFSFYYQSIVPIDILISEMN